MNNETQRIMEALMLIYGSDLQAATITVLLKDGETAVRFITLTIPVGGMALAQPEQEPVAWHAGLIDRIKAAERRIQDGHAPRRIPADPADVDLVLAEVRYLLEGKQPPFWIKTTPPAVCNQVEKNCA
jgi:hypothetical protein